MTVATTHFSDWALTFQGATAAAEGPITLVQTVGIPFTATGRATIYFQEDSATDTVYALTGTLTVPGSFTVDGKTCVPDQVTKTLPFNFAEVHKSEPPVFRWGIGVFWTLTCTAPGPVVTTELMPAMFDTMSINPPLCPADYLRRADRLGGPARPARTPRTAASDGAVSATWDLRTCVAGPRLRPRRRLPRSGETACTAGVQSCVDAGAAPDGTPVRRRGRGRLHRRRLRSSEDGRGGSPLKRRVVSEPRRPRERTGSGAAARSPSPSGDTSSAGAAARRTGGTALGSRR